MNLMSNLTLLHELRSKTVEQEYAAKYLELIGASSSKENVDALTRRLPLAEAFTFNNWMTDTLTIIPGIGDYIKLSDNQLLMKDGFENAENFLESISKERQAELNKISKHRRARDRMLPAIRRCSWGSVQTFDPKTQLEDRLDIEIVKSKEFHRLLYPPHIPMPAIMKPLQQYMLNLPLFVPQMQYDFKDKLVDSVGSLLALPESLQTFSLLAHYCYWNILHPLVRKTLLKLRDEENRKDSHSSLQGSVSSDDDLSLLELAHQLNIHQAALVSGNDEYFPSEVKRDSFSTISVHSQPDECNNQERVRKVSLSYSTASVEVGYDDSSSLSLASEGSLTSLENQAVFIQIQQCLDAITAKLGFSKHSMSVAHTAFVCACHHVVDAILVNLYPWLGSTIEDDFVDAIIPPILPKQDADIQSIAIANEEESISSRKKNKLPLKTKEESINAVKLEIRRLFHQSLADILDPGRVFLSTMLRTVYSGSKFFSTKNSRLLKNKKMKYHTTSLAVKAALGTSSSPDVIRIMRSGDIPYVPVPGYIRRPNLHSRSPNARTIPSVSALSNLHAKSVKHEDDQRQSKAIGELFNRTQSSIHEVNLKTLKQSSSTTLLSSDAYNHQDEPEVRRIVDLKANLRRLRNIGSHYEQLSIDKDELKIREEINLAKAIAANASKMIHEIPESKIKNDVSIIEVRPDLARGMSTAALLGSDDDDRESTAAGSNENNEQLQGKKFDTAKARRSILPLDYSGIDPELNLSAGLKTALVGMVSRKIRSQYRSGYISQQGKMKNPASRQQLIM